VWDAATGQEVLSLKHTGQVRSVCFADQDEVLQDDAHDRDKIAAAVRDPEEPGEEHGEHRRHPGSRAAPLAEGIGEAPALEQGIGDVAIFGASLQQPILVGLDARFKGWKVAVVSRVADQEG